MKQKKKILRFISFKIMGLNSLFCCVFIWIIIINFAVSEVKLSSTVDVNGNTEILNENKIENKNKKSKKIKNKDGKLHSKLNIMWVTPFEIFNFSTLNDGLEDTSFHNIMSDYGFDMYKRFINGLQSGHIKLTGIDDKATINDKFFAFQQYLHNEKRLHIKNANIPKDTLSQFYVRIEQITKIYLKKCGVDKDVINDALLKIKNREMFLWTSIHGNGTYHGPHYHQNSIVSGVYYVNIPSNMNMNHENTEIYGESGNLVLQDPRGGGIYPFGLKYYHRPIEGQIILFPSYVTHYVEPVRCKEPRISWSFNIPGSWDDLSDTSMVFDY